MSGNRSTFQNQLATEEYYQSVIRAMSTHGFRLMAWITLDSDQHEYHVSVDYAMHSQLYFTLPGKTMLVMLELVQSFDTNFGESRHHHYWHGWLYTRWDRLAELGDILRLAKNKWDVDVEAVGFNTYKEFEASPYIPMGSIFGFQNFEELGHKDPNSWTTAESLTAIFATIKAALEQYMYDRFLELDVGSFAPTYCFEKCEPWFMAQFPWDRLQTKVKRRLAISAIPRTRR